MEHDVTPEEALEIIAEHGGYGRVRVYAIIADGEECAGQIASIKSRYNLEKHKYSRIYAKSNNGTVPIRRA